MYCDGICDDVNATISSFGRALDVEITNPESKGFYSMQIEPKNMNGMQYIFITFHKKLITFFKTLTCRY